MESGRDRWHHTKMKHDHLCAIAHNLADSLASGMCFVIGIWSTDVFGEAAAGDGLIEVDFLGGQVVRGTCSDNIRSAVKRFAEILPEFCRANGADAGDFAALSAIFDAATTDYRVLLNVTDRNGKNSITEYAGLPLKRLRVIDPLGRVRRSPRRRPMPESERQLTG